MVERKQSEMRRRVERGAMRGEEKKRNVQERSDARRGGEGGGSSGLLPVTVRQAPCCSWLQFVL